MLTIYLRKTNGKGDKLHIDKLTLLDNLLAKIDSLLIKDSHKEEGHSHLFYELYHKGIKILPNSKQNVDQFGLSDDSIIHVLQHPTLLTEGSLSLSLDQKNIELSRAQSEKSLERVDVKLILSDKIFNYSVDRSDKIQSLKQKIAQDMEILFQDLTLTHLGEQMTNSKTAQDYRLHNEVLLSGHSAQAIRSNAFRLAQSISADSSNSNEGTQQGKIKVKRAESLHEEQEEFAEKKTEVHYSVRLKTTEKKDSDQKVCFTSQPSSPEQSPQNILNNFQCNGFKLTSSLGNYFSFDNQRVIETESIVDDDDEEDQIFSECQVELTRADQMHIYTFDCQKQHTFSDLRRMLAKLQGVALQKIVIHMLFDQPSKSVISQASSVGKKRQKRSQSPGSEKGNNARSQQKMRLQPVNIGNNLQSNILEKSLQLKMRKMCLEYGIRNQTEQECEEKKDIQLLSLHPMLLESQEGDDDN